MATAKKSARKKVIPKVKKVEAVKKPIYFGDAFTDPIESERVAVKPEMSNDNESLNLSGKYTGDANKEVARPYAESHPASVELPSINTATKPVTLAGKTVGISATGKVMLFDNRKNKIITGLIPVALAKKIVADFPNVEIMKDGKRG